MLTNSRGEEPEQESSEGQTQDESRFLNTLFASSGVHSALQHDSIMEASRPEVMLVEREASRVAKEAAEALRESRRQARRAEIGTPTWTGRSGGVPRFGSQNQTNGTGVGSDSLLARMRHRQSLEGPNVSSGRNSPAPLQRERGSTTPKSHVLIGQIHEFLSARGGSATSRDLVARFPDIKGPDAIAEFRKMVKQIADFKDSLWNLKED
jgi:DNA excision repair protein ERCC-6